MILIGDEYKIAIICDSFNFIQKSNNIGSSAHCQYRDSVVLHVFIFLLNQLPPALIPTAAHRWRFLLDMRGIGSLERGKLHLLLLLSQHGLSLIFIFIAIVVVLIEHWVRLSEGDHSFSHISPILNLVIARYSATCRHQVVVVCRVEIITAEHPLHIIEGRRVWRMHHFIIILTLLILFLALPGQSDALDLFADWVLWIILFLLDLSVRVQAQCLNRYFALLYDLIGQVLQIKARDSFVDIVEPPLLDRA